jgi:hypothetical protein
MRLAMRSGSNAVAKATIVKSGTRKKTRDRLIGFLGAVTFASRLSCREQNVANSKVDNR